MDTFNSKMNDGTELGTSKFKSKRDAGTQLGNSEFKDAICDDTE